jgi:transcriptional regulator with XRE-family HTH domain
MKSSKKKRGLLRRRIGISQSDMASYVGVSSSLFAMWERGRRNLPLTAFLKYTALEALLQQQKKTGKLTQQLQDRFETTHQKVAQKALHKISMHRPRAERLRKQLANREQQHAGHLAWISVLDEQLASPAAKKHSKGERLWLQLQQDAIAKKLIKNKTDMAKMQLDIDVLIAVAGVYEKHYGMNKKEE